MKPPFPMQRPEIRIEPSKEQLFEVDWRELAWWFVVPEVGDHAVWAIYNPPEWKLTDCEDLTAVRPAIVAGIEGVEIALLDYVAADSETYPQTMFGRLTENRVEWLATMLRADGKTKLYTLLDEGFDEDWGESQRHVRHTGRFTEQPDGSLHQDSERIVEGESVEALGVCEVTIGSHTFTCLRVIDVRPELNEKGILMEAYLTREGRTVLCRRYNGRLWKYGRKYAGDDRPWDERFPDHNRIVIDGVTFVHWYDCLTGLTTDCSD